jgi:formate dehydrogenase major subunit
MTQHWIDIKNADVVLIIGSNAAEHHPISFRWVTKAKDNGAVVIHVDPKFSRTSARADIHAHLRPGTDIAFMGGLIHYVLSNKKYFKEYVDAYTNAAHLVGEKYAFNDGLFSGWNADKRAYDRSQWNFELDEKGQVKKDPTYKNPRCVINLLEKHYERYNLKNVAATTGIPEKELEVIYGHYASTGTRDRVATIMYALGWTQHTYGVQIIRTSGILQLLLGNVGVAGGGVNAMRGEPNVQGSTDYALLYHILPGYNPMPFSTQPTLADYNKANTPLATDPKSANWWGNRPKYMASMLKAWFGDAATPENDFGYGWLPKADPSDDFSYMYMFDRAYKGQMKGGFIVGLNPAQSVPNSNKVRKALDNFDWLIMMELHHSETTDNWHRPGVDPKKVKTECFLIPSAHRLEREGTISNSGRWQMWHNKAIKEPAGVKSFGDFHVELMNKVIELYKKDGGTLPEPIVNLDWPQKFDADTIAKKNNGYYTKDVTVKDKQFKKGQLVAGFANLADDGSTACTNWIYCGSYIEDGKPLFKRRDLTQTPEQAAIGLFPNFAWCWPVNRRILYNRAGVDPDGNPWNPAKMVIAWKDGKWVGDVPDGAWPPMSQEGGKNPFIMTQSGMAQLYGPGRLDGPFPEHYEPVETPITQHPFSKQLSSPVYKFFDSDLDKLAKPADAAFPIVLTTYSMTEHWCGGGETRNVPNLLEAEPQLYVEMSQELAKEKGIKNGDGVIVESIRGRVEAIAMVTVRMKPLTVQGKTVHVVGMPFCFGWTTKGCGDSTNRLTVGVGDPNTSIPEYKACLVNVKKADKLTELA